MQKDRELPACQGESGSQPNGQTAIPVRISYVAASPELTNNKSNLLATVTKNSLANLFRVGSSWIIILLLPPLLIRVMDKPAYAVWLLLLQLAAYITFFDGGIQMAIARYVARHEGAGARTHLAHTLSSVGFVLIVTSVITILIVGVTSWHLTDLFRSIPSEISWSSRFALFVIGTSLALNLPFSVLAGFFLGRQQNEIAALAATAGKFAGAMGSGWAAYHHQGLLAMALWVAAGNMIQSLVYYLFWKRGATEGLLHPSAVEQSVAREFVVFCSSMLVAQFSSLLITGMDMPVVAAFDFRAAAYYGIASILSNILAVPHGAIVTSLLPVAAEISAKEDPHRLGQALLKTTRFGTSVLCLITLPLFLLMPLFLRVWVGADYATHAMFLGEILVVAQFIRLTMFPYAIIGFVAGQQQRMLISPLAEGITNLVCSVGLAQIMGARGVAFGTLIGALVGVWLHLTVSMSKTDCVRISRSQFLGQGILKPMTFTLPFLLCVQLNPLLHSPWLSVLVAAAAEFTVCLLFWWLVFDEGERNDVRRLLRRYLHYGQRSTGQAA
jgi:O-antigen/teichoic acid export membrane protein